MAQCMPGHALGTLGRVLGVPRAYRACRGRIGHAEGVSGMPVRALGMPGHVLGIPVCLNTLNEGLLIKMCGV